MRPLCVSCRHRVKAEKILSLLLGLDGRPRWRTRTERKAKRLDAKGFRHRSFLGITVKSSGRTSFDLEFVPFIQDSPRKVSLTVHPGLLYGLGHGFTAGARLAFDVNSSQFGFTPLLNKSWPIEGSFFKAYFVEAVLPVRFDRPTAGPNTNPVSFGMHFGVGF